MATSPLLSPVYAPQARASAPATVPPPPAAPAPVAPISTDPVSTDPVVAPLLAAPAATPSVAAPPSAHSVGATGVAVVPAQHVRAARRQVSPISGIALEALGHAIEYLADEYALHAGGLAAIHAHDPQVEAIQILMAANRQVYFDCPLAPSLAVRCKRVVARLWG